MIAFRCRACGRTVRAPENAAGKRARCQCGHGVVVPQTPVKQPAASPPDWLTAAPGPPQAGPATAAPQRPVPTAAGNRPNDISLIHIGWPWYVGGGVAALAILTLTIVLLLSFGRNRDAGAQAQTGGPPKSGQEQIAQTGTGQEIKSTPTVDKSGIQTGPKINPGPSSTDTGKKPNPSPPPPPPPPSYPERKLLPGVWRLVQAQSAGTSEEIMDDGADFLITSDALMGKNHEYYFRFVDGAGPARLECLRPDGTLAAGIFSIDGDFAKISLWPKEKGFPADFSPKSEPGTVLLSLQRQKTDDKSLFLWDFSGFWSTDGMNFSCDRSGRGQFFINDANGLTIGSHSLRKQNGEFFVTFGNGPRIKLALGPTKKTLELLNTANGQKVTLVGGSGGDPRGPVSHLNLTGPLVTNASLPIMGSFKGLKGVALLGANVDVQGVKQLATMTGLESLHISTAGGAAIGPDALPHLARLTRLRRLALPGAALTGERFQELAALTMLDDLDLGQAAITDAGLRELAQLGTVKFLNLAGTQITDAGLPLLAKLNRLEYLRLDDTQVSDAGVRALQNALPKCKISNFSNKKKS